MSFFFFLQTDAGAQSHPVNHNIVWDSQSINSSASMPCGGGDIGLNVWVENDDVLFYLSRSGTFDENNQFLKLGRVRLHFSTDYLHGKNFRQVLNVQEGSVHIYANGLSVLIWVDVFRPIVHVAIQSHKVTGITVSYENWRFEDHPAEGLELRANSYKVTQPFKILTYKDSVSAADEKLYFMHRNRSDIQNVFDYTVKVEGMDSVKSQLYNPIQDNTFGGILYATNMRYTGSGTGKYASTKYKSWKFETKKPVHQQEISIALHVAQSSSEKVWKNELDAILSQSANETTKTILKQNKEWWHQFWERSYITIEGKDSFISRNYQLFRYMLACNAYGKWPTKFNGGLFTFDPEYVDEKYPYSPDFRLWGGGTMTAQNQRLVYYPFLKNGDADMLLPQLDFYLRLLKNAELRSAVYWKHGGACFTEQLENFGLPNVFEYGLKRPDFFDKGVEYNSWLEYTWETVFEFCLMMLDKERYTGQDISPYIPFIESCLTFYDQHYRYLAQHRDTKVFNDKGEYIFYPSSAAETYKEAYNSTTVISALHTILNRLLELPDVYAKSVQRNKWTEMLQHIPPLPVTQFTGKTILAPAAEWSRIQNTESPQLYPVFPWYIYGIGKPGLDIAINTYQLDSQVIKTKSFTGWRQHNIFAARLGLTEEAKALTLQKFKDGKHRFPVFWGPGFDWTPDHNWGGTAMIGLQEMLMQADGKNIYLLPAWPKEWNVEFKLHAPLQTIIEGKLKDGKFEFLTVTPPERQKDIQICLPQ